MSMEARYAGELLARERRRVEGALADLEGVDRADAGDPHEAGDPAPDLLESEMEDGLAERLRDELRAIERAEKRLEEGQYGLSIDSGEPIPDGRLEIIPWAERTADEQSRYEGSTS